MKRKCNHQQVLALMKHYNVKVYCELVVETVNYILRMKFGSSKTMFEVVVVND